MIQWLRLHVPNVGTQARSLVREPESWCCLLQLRVHVPQQKISCDPVDAGNLISGPSAFSKTSLNIWKFTVQVLLKPGLENFEHYFTSVWDECNCVVVWAFFGIAFLWDWNENNFFQSCGHCWVFQICWHIECTTFTTSSFRIWNSSTGIRRRQWHPTPVFLPGKSHGQRSLVGCSPWGRQEWDMTEQLHFHFSLSCIGEGNGNTLQCSCLENPRDRGAWWTAIHGVAQSWTWLKRLGSCKSSNWNSITSTSFVHSDAS